MLVNGVNGAILAGVRRIGKHFGAILSHLFFMAKVTSEVEEDAASIKVGETAQIATAVAGLVGV
jgi:hypothetical protein